MMELTATSSRMAAEYMPTGPTANQVKDRANKAGTDGPPPTATTRADRFDQARDSLQRAVEKTDDRPNDDPVARGVIEDQMRRQEAPETAQNAAEQSTTLAKAAFEQTQFITAKADAARAEKMRIAM